jgi:phosphoribosylaminoimidazole carboxylase PurE protein
MGEGGAKVLILMGSDSDLEVMKEARDTLSALGISSKMTVASAHRTPERTRRLIREAEEQGASVIIAGAGMAAHLAGFVAAHTVLPVIGVPMDSGPLRGVDALLSTVQMPPGVPVATVSIGKAGARNAAILAAQILAVSDPHMRERLETMRKKASQEIEAKAKELEERER